MPGQSVSIADCVQRVADLTRVTGETGQCRDLAIGGYAPGRYATNDGVDTLVGTFSRCKASLHLSPPPSARRQTAVAQQGINGRLTPAEFHKQFHGFA